MIKHCKSTFANQQQFSFTLYLFIMTFFVPLLLQQLPSFVSILFLISLDYFTSFDFYHVIIQPLPLSFSSTATSPIHSNDDIDITEKKNTNNTTTSTKKPILLIDTTKTHSTPLTTIKKQDQTADLKNNDNNDSQQQQSDNKETETDNNLVLTSPESLEMIYLTTKQDNVAKLIEKHQHHRRRHNSVSCHSNIDFYIKSPPPPHLSPSTSSVSSVSSNWSLDSSKRSRVEEMIYLFEMGGRAPHRRYSVDSHNYYTTPKPLIRQRRFEYQPIASEWKKRVNGSAFPVELSPSKSTPVRRKMPPIPEKSKSTWA